MTTDTTTTTVAGDDLKIGDWVEKIAGDSEYAGFVVARFTKRSGLVRFVVEDDRRQLHVHPGTSLRRVPRKLKR